MTRILQISNTPTWLLWLILKNMIVINPCPYHLYPSFYFIISCRLYTLDHFRIPYIHSHFFFHAIIPYSFSSVSFISLILLSAFFSNHSYNSYFSSFSLPYSFSLTIFFTAFLSFPLSIPSFPCRRESSNKKN